MAQQLSMLTALIERSWAQIPVPKCGLTTFCNFSSRASNDFFLASPSAAQTYLHKSKAIIYIKNRHQMNKQSNELMIKLTLDAYQIQKHKWSINT